MNSDGKDGGKKERIVGYVGGKIGFFWGNFERFYL